MKEIERRKQAHVDLCLDPQSQSRGELFAHYLLPYKALPEIDLTSIDLSTSLFKHTLSQPLIIGSMTGGSRHAKTINPRLAEAAEACQVAIGVGSQRIALEIEEAKESFVTVRKYAPTAFLFANMGAVQLNYGRGIEDFQRIVDMVKANSLYLHINPLQEAIQPEGNTNYTGLLDKIAQLVKKIDVPVFVKEVGHGIDFDTAQKLVDCGVTGIDTAGVGGTSYAWVEASRRQDPLFQDWFKNVGCRTDVLIEQYQAIKGDCYKVVSGGVRTPLEIVKAGVLGANFYSMAQPFLPSALESSEAVVKVIQHMEEALKITLFSCGCNSWKNVTTIKLSHTPLS